MAGQTAAYGIIDKLIENGDALRINTRSSDFIPSAMRKWGSNDDMDQLERLYEIEKDLRGANSSASLYELFKAYRRSGRVDKIVDLLPRAQKEGVELKQEFVDEVNKWLAKRRI